MYGNQEYPILGSGRVARTNETRTGNAGEIFSYRCAVSANSKITRKEERSPLGNAVYQYAYDGKGHLTEVTRNGRLIEKYTYDAEGRRTEDYRVSHGGSRQFIYGYDGALIRVNDAYLEWTPKGQLQAIYSHDQRAEYEYGEDTRLDKVFLPSGTMIGYRYEDELMPVTVMEGYEQVLQYTWKNTLQLQQCVDIRNGVAYDFFYKGDGTPESVILKGPAHKILGLTGILAANVRLRIWVDQIGSIRALSSADGKVIKYIEYDAFGNVTHEIRSEWSFPLGFAGGLHDVYTGFVRFGFRDYDPQVGRFTAKDPIGDTGGDHDLWDYCVDDPISKRDITGLIEGLSKFLIQQAGGALAGKMTGVGWLLFPNRANDPEMMYPIRDEIIKIERKLEQEEATSEEIKRIKKLQEQENELWDKYGKHYEKGYERVFPSEDYIKEKIKNAKKRR